MISKSPFEKIIAVTYVQTLTFIETLSRQPGKDAGNGVFKTLFHFELLPWISEMIRFITSSTVQATSVGMSQ